MPGGPLVSLSLARQEDNIAGFTADVWNVMMSAPLSICQHGVATETANCLAGTAPLDPDVDWRAFVRGLGLVGNPCFMPEDVAAASVMRAFPVLVDGRA
jgi:hypothetical protein